MDEMMHHLDYPPLHVNKPFTPNRKEHIVSAIIEGALRLVSPNQDPAGEALRKGKIQARAKQALHAEREFIEKSQSFSRQDNGRNAAEAEYSGWRRQ